MEAVLAANLLTNSRTLQFVFLKSLDGVIFGSGPQKFEHHNPGSSFQTLNVSTLALEALEALLAVALHAKGVQDP